MVGNFFQGFVLLFCVFCCDGGEGGSEREENKVDKNEYI